jgi:putative ABC transport system substrate-binding protein
MDRRRFVALAGGALAASLARAQQSRKPVRIGFLSPALASLKEPFWAPLVASLAKYGWREDIEFSLVLKESRGDPARALAMAHELAAEKVDLILAITTACAFAARNATQRIPVVTWCGYPVESGLAESLARPGGNVTGVANYAGSQVWGKFGELLRELKPGLRELGVLWDYAPPGFPDGQIPLPIIEKSAQQMGIRTRTWMVRSEQDLDSALVAIDRSQIEALILSQGGGFHSRPELGARIAELVVRRRLPAIVDVASVSVFEQASCVLAYSPNVLEILDRLARFVDRVLRGANPASLPFELPARFDLAVSAKAAKAIGLALPQSLLLRADRVIE